MRYFNCLSIEARKRLGCTALSLALASTMVTPALAAGSASDIQLTVEGQSEEIVSFIVPDVIPINMDKDGVVTTSDNLKMQNLGDKDIEVTAMSVEGKSDWQIVDYQDDLSSEPDNTHKLSMSFNGDKTDRSGNVQLTDGNWDIAAHENLGLSVNAKLPKQTVADDTTTSIAQVNYTFETRDDTTEPPEPTEKFTVTYTSDGNGNVSEDSRTFKQGAYITFPDTTPLEGFTFDKWVDSTTESEVTTQTIVESDMEVKATFKEDAKEVIEIELTTENKSLLGIDGTETELDFSQPIEGTDGKLYQVVAIGDNAFYDNTKLKQINLDGVKTIGYAAFSGCENITNLIIPDSLKEIDTYSFSGIGIDYLDIPNTVEVLGDSVFTACENLVEVTFQDGITEIPTATFRDCKNLESITISNTIVSIGAFAFSGNENLKNIDIPYSVNSIGTNAFSYCYKLESIYLPNGIQTIPDFCFYDCKNLKSVTIPTSITSIGLSAFFDCRSLKSLSIPDTVTSIGPGDVFNNVPHIYYNGSASGSPWGALAIN